MIGGWLEDNGFSLGFRLLDVPHLGRQQLLRLLLRECGSRWPSGGILEEKWAAIEPILALDVRQQVLQDLCTNGVEGHTRILLELFGNSQGIIKKL